jgi:PKD repeat protein
MACLSSLALSQSASWTAYKPDFFPTNASGQIHGISRVSQLKFHPSNSQKMYAVSARGGLFISTNGGNNWTIAPGCDNMTLGTRFASICIDHTNDQILYLGGGDHNYYSSGSGVFKSTNGGSTFTSIGLGGKIIVELIMDPSNNQVLVAATNTGIYKTTDGGSTWTLKTGSIQFDDLKQKTGTGSRVLFATTRGAEIYRSLDFGDTWSQITSGVYIPTGYTSGGGTRVAVTPADSNVVYFYMNAKGGTLFKSTDGGSNFVNVKDTLSPYLTGYTNSSADPGQGDYNTGIGVDGVNPNIVYFVAHVVWKSLDGGVTWTQLTNWYQKVHTDMHQSINSPYNNNQLWNVNDGGVWLSTDGGNNWVQKSDGIYGYEIYHGGCSPTRRDMVSIGTQDNGELYATNSGWFTNRGGDWQSNCVFDYRANSSMVYYYLPDWGTVQVPKRRLVTGSSATYGLPASVTDFSDITYHRSNSDLAFVGDTVVWRTTSLTATTPTWTSIFNTNVKIMGMHAHFADANRLYVVTNDGKIHISTNALSTTPTFTTVILPSATNSKGRITSIKSNLDVVYLTANSNVYRSSDNGLTWTSIKYNLPNYNHAEILGDEYFSSNELVFIATGGSVYYKTATATNWTSYSTGLPSRTSIVNMSIYNDSTANTLLRVFTYGRGVWETPISSLRSLAANFAADNTTPCSGASITFSNLSTGTYTSSAWSFPGGNPSSSTASNPVVTYATPGLYTVSLTVTGPTGSSTETKTNYINAAGLALPVSQNFESAVFPPTNWTNNDATSNAGSWALYTGVGGFGNSNYSMYFDNYSVDANGAYDEFRSINIDMSGVTGGALTFDLAYQPYSLTSYIDSMQVLVSTNCGATFSSVYLKSGAALATVTGTNTSEFVPSATQWRTESINMNAFAGQNVMVAFRNIGHYGNNIYIDNIQLLGNAPCNLSMTSIETQTSCAGGNNGTLLVNASGGNGTITYTLSPGAASNTSGFFDGLTAGTYTVTATDANGCTVSIQSTITSPSPLGASASYSPVVCFGGTTVLTVAASGGTPPYSGTGNYNVSAGSYSYTVTDANGCTAVISGIVTQPAQIIPTITASGPTSFCQGGQVTLSTGNYSSYLWNTGSTGASISVNASGNYIVTVTDAQGCSGTSATTIVTVSPSVAASVSISSNAPATILSNTNITFTATTTNGGNLPVYQWKKNGVNVGTNSSTYSNSAWVNGDAVSCVLTSNANCVVGSPATSNTITIPVTQVAPKYAISDITQNKVFYYDAAFSFIQSNTLSTATLNGVTNASDLSIQTNFGYVLDQTNKRLYRRNAPSGVATPSAVLRTNTGQALGTPTGIAISSDTLWVLDKKGKAVYRYSMSSAFATTGNLNALAKITLASTLSNGESLFAYGANLYILNNGTTKVLHRYPKAGGTATLSRPMVNTTGTALSLVTGVVLDGLDVFVTDNGIDRALKYSLTSLYTGSGNLNASAVFTLQSTNLNSTGISLCSGTNLLRETDAPAAPSKVESLELKIYPNPSEGEVHLVISGDLSESSLIRVVDISGKAVYSQSLSADDLKKREIVFDLSAYGKGEYIATVYTLKQKKSLVFIVQ